MGEIACVNKECDDVVLTGDRFCGTCGTPVAEPPPPRAATLSETRIDSTNWGKFNYGTSTDDGPRSRPANGTAAAAPASVSPPSQPSGAPFFSHNQRRPPGPISNATSFLCSAAYLDNGFANKVILNLLMTRKAVAPSVNFDVGPVLRHCLRARRNILWRDIALVVIVLIGLAVRTLPTLDVLLFTFVLGGTLPNVGRGRSLFRNRLVMMLASVAAGGLAIVFTVFLVAGSIISSLFSGGVSMASVLSALINLAITFAVLIGALATTEFVYLRTTAQALTGKSRPGAESRHGLSRATEQRLAMVEGAQYGNVSLHTGWSPFLGAGDPTQKHWSVATPLRAEAGRDENGRKLVQADSYVPIDPVDLHQFIGKRLRAFNDPNLKEYERIAALTVSDRLVGTGWIPAGDPLFDQNQRTPYSQASPEAIKALIKHPQARLRYYQQISVDDESPAVMSNGRKVIDSVDQEVAVSAFVYAAVEGRMLYLQFVLTALPPINAVYRAARMSYANSTSRMLVYTFKRLFSSIFMAVPGIWGAFRLRRIERSWEKIYTSAVGGDYGADISVRELGTADDFNRYMQVLDVEKYNMMISKALLDAVTDYLAARKIDISALANTAQSIINNNTNINNNGVFNAPVNQQTGHGSTMKQTD